jgi:hypothetical protein
MTSEFLGEAVFPLPGGLALDDGPPLTTAVLRPIDGFAEEWLAHASEAPSAVKVTRLLSACLVSLDDQAVTTELVRRLLVGDRDYLMLQLRRLTFGDEVMAVLTCPECGEPMDVSFRASEAPVEARTQTTSSHAITIEDRTVRFRLPTGGDQEALLGMEVDAAADQLLQRCMCDDGGRPLTAEEREAVIASMEQLAPQVELELDLTCPECSHEFIAPFDTTTFFFDEMRINGEQLLREIHSLAFYYHWSESDILGLRRSRRRAYLALLNEALKRE